MIKMIMLVMGGVICLGIICVARSFLMRVLFFPFFEGSSYIRDTRKNGEEEVLR